MRLKLATATGRAAWIDIDDTINGEKLAVLCSELLYLPLDRLRLVKSGLPLNLEKVSISSFKVGDTVLAVVAPKPPSDDIRKVAQGPLITEEEAEDRALFQLNLAPSAPAWQRKLSNFLLHKLRIPEYIVSLLFKIRPMAWMLLVLWLIGSKVAAFYDAGGVYFVCTIFVLIATNLGTRAEGTLSGYSLFNPGVQRLPGQLTAEHIDRQMRHQN